MDNIPTLSVPWPDGKSSGLPRSGAMAEITAQVMDETKEKFMKFM